MTIFDVISMLGGLGLFLYGMHLMGVGLKKVAGGKLEGILERLSSTPVRGVILGTVVTAIIQSSSATTVMVVGFVNSGIMKLTQAIGVIMGAKIGTTMTGWLLSLSGIQGEVWWLKIFQPATFSPIIALIGAIIIMFVKDQKKQHIASIMVGFAVLMYGMTAMSSAADPLADSTVFIDALSVFSNPILGMLLGIVMTAVIQSASASIGILQALSLTGTLPYSTAIPVILGMNIGACVPVLLSSIGAGKDGKRAAVVYLYYNLIGTALFMPVFYLINYFFPFSFYHQSANALGIAVFNTFFSVLTTVIMIPFVKQFESLAKLTIKDKPNEHKNDRKDLSEVLDERFLTTPGYALKQCKNVVNDMANLSGESIARAVTILRDYDEESAAFIAESEERVDEYEDKLGTYLVKLSAQSLLEADNRDVSKLLHSIGDFERISDHAKNLLDRANEIKEKSIRFSASAERELDRISDAVCRITKLAVDCFVSNDEVLAGNVEPLEQIIDLMCSEFKKHHVERLQHGECTIDVGFVFNDILTDFERISDHCSNIAVTVIRLNHEVYDTHQYLNEIKNSDSGEFKRLYDLFKVEYFDEFD